MKRYNNKPMPYPKVRLPEDDRKRLMVVGPEFPPEKYSWLCKTLDYHTFGMVDPYVIVAGHSKNTVDAAVMNWAQYNWYVVRIHYLDSKELNLTVARQKRLEEMYADATHLIAFCDGTSWVEDALAGAKKHGIKCRAVYH